MKTRFGILGYSILICFVTALLSGCGARVREIDFYENLDEKVLSVDGTEYTLRDLALYIAYEEAIVQEDALLYDPENPMRYWNIHTNGEFIRVRARNEAMDSAIHDMIFLNMALSDKVELDDGEKEYALSTFGDFWDDLSDEQRDLLEDLFDVMQQSALDMALAQKYQVIFAAMEDAEPEEYDKDGEAYLKMLAGHDIETDQYIWKGIGFGHITLIY